MSKIVPKSAVIEQVLDTDYNLGAGWSAEYPNLVEKWEDWEQYKSKPENQASGMAGETSTCTNQSSCEVMETQTNYQLMNGLLPEETVKFLKDEGYIGEDGKVNYSESFQAVMSGTTDSGNSLTQVAWSINHYGLVPESRHKDDFSSKANFFRQPILEMKQLGLKWLIHFGNEYSWIFHSRQAYKEDLYKNMLSHVLEAPPVIAVPVCSPWDTNVEFCGRVQSDHAMVLYGGTPEKVVVGDSYNPYTKILDKNYVINAAMKMMLIVKKRTKKQQLISR